MSVKKIYLTTNSLIWIFTLSFCFLLLVMTSMKDFSDIIYFNTSQNDPELMSSKAEPTHQLGPKTKPITLPPIVSKEDADTFLKEKFDQQKQEWITKEDSEIFKNNLSIQKILKRGAISFTGIMGPSEMSQLNTIILRGVFI